MCSDKNLLQIALKLRNSAKTKVCMARMAGCMITSNRQKSIFIFIFSEETCCMGLKNDKKHVDFTVRFLSCNVFCGF